jgi:predicted dienelactone hydrolase
LSEKRIVNEVDAICRRRFLASLTRTVGLSAALTAGLSACAVRPSGADPAGNAGLSRAAALAAAVPMPDDAAVQTHYLDWHDSTRDRPVAAKLYLPADAPRDQAVPRKLPLLVVSHGLGGSREGYSYLGKFLATQGYACLHLQHVGSDRSLWSGNVLSLVSRLQAAAHESEAIHRVDDMRFALDQLLTSRWGESIDPTHIMAAGHSYGANTCLLACGATVQRVGPSGQQTLNYRDARIRAAVVISAPPFYGMGDMRSILASVQVPTLHITSTSDEIIVPGYHSAPADRISVFDAIGGPRKTLAVFQGGSHSMFTDRLNTGGAELNPKVKVATRQLALAFLNHIRGASAQPMTAWAKDNQALLDRFELNS